MLRQAASRWGFFGALALTAAYILPASAEASASQTTRAAGEGKLRVQLQIRPRVSGAAGQAIAKADIVRTQQVLQNRVTRYGLPAPRLQFQPADRIVLEIAVGESTVQLLEDLKALLTEPGLLEFRAVPRAYAEGEKRRPIETYATGSRYAFRDAAGKEVPTERVLAQSAILATSRDLVPNAAVITNPGQEPLVSFELREPARSRFEAFTRTHVGTWLAFALDGDLVSCAPIRSAVRGRGVIGALDQPGGAAHAKRLSVMMNSGPLPLPVHWVNARPVREGR